MDLEIDAWRARTLEARDTLRRAVSEIEMIGSEYDGVISDSIPKLRTLFEDLRGVSLSGYKGGQPPLNQLEAEMEVARDDLANLSNALDVMKRDADSPDDVSVQIPCSWRTKR